jgi:hypothetical protein
MSDELTKDEAALKLSGGKNATWWKREVSRSRKSWKDYRDRANAVIRRYRDERESERDSGKSKNKRFNILFSNVETLKPAIYSQVPVPDIRRRWQDKDAVARVSALVLQRGTQYCVESYDFDSVLESCNQDYLLPGFAVARVKYQPYIKRRDPAEEAGEPKDDATEEASEELVWEEVQSEYVPWDRFIMSRSKHYERVWYVGFGDDLTKSEVAEQFGKDIAEELSYSKLDEDDPDRNEAEPTVRVWEVWCKRGRGRFCLAEGFDGWLKEPEPDPLRLEGFYPNSRPIWSIATNDTLVPIPEYCEYQDQAMELDDITDRIDVLTSALRRRGVYDAALKELAGMLTENTSDNCFVPIENWAAFTEKGGLERVALEMPLEGVIGAIVALDNRREVVKQIIYEVTGIADIVRGSSNPNETLGAQQLKGKWAGLRISTRQKKFANFARDLIRLKAEIIAERFKPETLALMTGIQLPYAQQKQQWQQAQQTQQQQAQMQAQQAQQAGQQPPPPPKPPSKEEQDFYAQPTWEDVIQVLRDDKLRGFKIDIETDSTVQPDADAEKQARTELLTALGDFCQRMAPAIQSGLMPREAAVEAIQFTMRAFKADSSMEQAFEQMNAAPGPSPQQQQKEQELQKREQAVKQAEDKAKDTTHQAQMATKDAESAGKDVQHQKELMDLEAQYQQKFDALQKQFMDDVQNLVGHAEGTVRDIVKNMDGLRGPMDQSRGVSQ